MDRQLPPPGGPDRPAAPPPVDVPHAPHAGGAADALDDAARWRAQRRDAAAAHGEALAARQRAESERARALIAQFVADARRQGVAPVPLHVRSYDGAARYRTPLEGWYLRRDGTVGVDTAGEFYVLTARPSLVARFRGVRPLPQDPPLVIGAGGKDGESVDLPVALARALAGEV